MFFNEKFHMGDLVHAKSDLHSDGHIPNTREGELIVPKGRRGVVIRIGHAEHDPSVDIYLVQFENEQRELGPIIGCLASELMQPAA